MLSLASARNTDLLRKSSAYLSSHARVVSGRFDSDEESSPLDDATPDRMPAEGSFNTGEVKETSKGFLKTTVESDRINNFDHKYVGDFAANDIILNDRRTGSRLAGIHR